MYAMPMAPKTPLAYDLSDLSQPSPTDDVISPTEFFNTFYLDLFSQLNKLIDSSD